MSWEILVTTFLGSGASFTLLTLIFDHRRRQQEREESAGFLALRIAFQLEAYAIACAAVASDHELARDSDQHAGKLTNDIPALAALPKSEAYHLLDKTLVHAVFEFPQRRDIARQAADIYLEGAADPDSYSEALQKSTVQLGAEAISVAKRLRRCHGQPERSLSWGNGFELAAFFAEIQGRLEP
jgi:hypothetical protein